MLQTGPYQVSLQQQIRFYSQIFGTKHCRYNKGSLYHCLRHRELTVYFGSVWRVSNSIYLPKHCVVTEVIIRLSPLNSLTHSYLVSVKGS